MIVAITEKCLLSHNSMTFSYISFIVFPTHLPKDYVYPVYHHAKRYIWRYLAISPPVYRRPVTYSISPQYLLSSQDNDTADARPLLFEAHRARPISWGKAVGTWRYLVKS